MRFGRSPNLIRTVVCAGVALLLAACAIPTPDTGSGNEDVLTATPPAQPGEPQTDLGSKLAQVEGVQAVILESFPVQVHAVVRGNLADGCTEIDQIEQNRDIEDKRFEVTITTSRDPDKICTQALVPFEETVPLDVRDLPKGVYTVDVNGVQASFELQQDNQIPSD
jgi:inhibitor of cysteine peptidase